MAKPTIAEASSDSLAGVMQEFVETADHAALWAKKWKVKAALIERATWAFHGDDGLIKVIGCIIPNKANGASLHAAKLFIAAEWAIRSGVNLAIVIGDRLATVKLEDIVECMQLWKPYVSDAGVMVGVHSLFKKETK